MDITTYGIKRTADFSVILTETAGENQSLNNAGPILRHKWSNLKCRCLSSFRNSKRISHQKCPPQITISRRLRLYSFSDSYLPPNANTFLLFPQWQRNVIFSNGTCLWRHRSKHFWSNPGRGTKKCLCEHCCQFRVAVSHHNVWRGWYTEKNSCMCAQLFG